MNAIDNMVERWKEEFNGIRKPLRGLDINRIRPTANNAPRLPQSQIPSPKPQYSSPGRPKKEEPPKIRRTWEGFL